MVATTLDSNGDIPIGLPVLTKDGERLGYVVDGDAYQLVVGNGFLFRGAYAISLADVERYEDGKVYLKWTMEQVRQASYDA